MDTKHDSQPISQRQPFDMTQITSGPTSCKAIMPFQTSAESNATIPCCIQYHTVSPCHHDSPPTRSIHFGSYGLCQEALRGFWDLNQARQAGNYTRAALKLPRQHQTADDLPPRAKSCTLLSRIDLFLIPKRLI